jgi:hypothetical protein
VENVGGVSRCLGRAGAGAPSGVACSADDLLPPRERLIETTLAACAAIVRDYRAHIERALPRFRQAATRSAVAASGLTSRALAPADLVEGATSMEY